MSAYYNLRNSRSSEQTADMEALASAGICIFCPGEMRKQPEHLVQYQSEWWTVTNNRFPYRGAKEHYLIVPKPHVGDVVDLPAEAQADWWPTLKWVRDKFDLKYYALGVRCGDFRFTGATIEHVHFHLVVGDVFAPGHEPVRMKMSAPAAPHECAG